MDSSMIYLDTYILQKDMRIRLPKMILTNMGVEKGVSLFDIYYDGTNQMIVLKVNDNSEGMQQDETV